MWTKIIMLIIAVLEAAIGIFQVKTAIKQRKFKKGTKYYG